MEPLVFPLLLSPRNLDLEMEKNAGVGRGRQGPSLPAATTAKAPNS